MKTRTLLILAVAGLLSLAACDEAGLTTTTLADGATTTQNPTTADDVANDIATTVAEVQAEVTQLANEVQNSAVAAELEESWDALQAEVLAAIAAIRDDGTIDGSQIQAALDSFQSDLDALGDQIEPSLVDAWDTLRNRLESLMS
jgi:glucose/arabinose dehydrogenase